LGLSQALPSVTGVKTQPEVGAQVSSVQALLSLHTSGVPAAQVPAWQVSAPLQALPSLHEVPLPTGVWVQVPSGAQASAVQGLWSSQSLPGPGWQTPAW